MPYETLSTAHCFGGRQGFYRHKSASTGTAMRFAVFTPPQAATRPVPVLWCLAGLTCTEENFSVKAGAQRRAAELGLMLVMPNTSRAARASPMTPRMTWAKARASTSMQRRHLGPRTSAWAAISPTNCRG